MAEERTDIQPGVPSAQPFAKQMVDTIDGRIDRKTRNGAQVEYTWGQIAAFDYSDGTASAYVRGESTYASEGFRLKNGVIPVIGSYAKLAIDHALEDRWVEEIDSSSSYFRYGFNPESGYAYWGDATSPYKVRTYYDESIGSGVLHMDRPGTINRLILDGEVDIRSTGTTAIAVASDLATTASFPFLVRADTPGKIEWGPGGAARDVSFSRPAGSTRTLVLDANDSNANPLDLFLQGTITIRTDRASSHAILVTASPTATSNLEFRLATDGKMEWGAGPGQARDTNLYRTSSGSQLKTDGSLVVGGLFNPEARTRLTGIISPSQLSANQNDWNPVGFSTASVVRITTDATPRTITGMAAGVNGDMVYLINCNATTQLTLSHQSSSSTAANRFFCAGATNEILHAGDGVICFYDGTTGCWRVIND